MSAYVRGNYGFIAVATALQIAYVGSIDIDLRRLRRISKRHVAQSRQRIMLYLFTEGETKETAPAFVVFYSEFRTA